MISRQRLVAPCEHLGVLIEPDAETIRSAIRAGGAGASILPPEGGAGILPPEGGVGILPAAARLDEISILDTTVGALRRSLCRRLQIEAPVILTGHQAEFFHAGVLAKNIAVSALVERLGGSPVFLMVDSDTPKAVQVAVPVVEDGTIQREYERIPGCDAALPMEHQARLPAEQWSAFFDLLEARCSWRADSMLAVYRQGWLADAPDGIDVRSAFERANLAVETALGIRPTRPLRISQICETPEFRSFVAHLALDAPRFRQDYNDAQQTYRRRHRIRSMHRPVEPLIEHDQGMELPLWVVRAGQSRRRLFVQRRDKTLVFRANEQTIGEAQVDALRRCETHEHPWVLENEGWRIRTRALTLSAFCRLFLSDLFVHGIGGAKYDEMMEDCVQRFVGVEPTAMACVSATLHLPLPQAGTTAEHVRAARRRWRDTHYNPQRQLTNLPAGVLRERETLIAESKRLRREEPRNHARRRQVFDAIRDVNHRLLDHAPAQVAALHQTLRDLEDHWRQTRLARDREYFFALHPRRSLEQLAERINKCV